VLARSATSDIEANEHNRNTRTQETPMKSAMLMGTVIWALGAVPSSAESIDEGQRAAPPSIANQLVLPDCGFAATESWGPNGFQYCDPRNIEQDSQGHIHQQGR
jgi:hypothetical protein